MSYGDIMAGFHAAGQYRLASVLGLSKQLQAEWRTAAILSDNVDKAITSGVIPKKQTTWRSRYRSNRHGWSKVRSNYPYLYHAHKEAGVDLLSLASRLVPAHIPDFLRADMCQDIIVAMLSGEIDRDKPAKDALRRKMAKVYRMHDLKYETVSLDEPVKEGAMLTFKDFLTADALTFW